MQAVGHPTGHALNHPPKHRKRAVGQDAVPALIGTICRSDTSEPSGKMQGPSGTIRQSDTRASRRASRCRGAVCNPVVKPQPVGAADIEPNPLDYSL